MSEKVPLKKEETTPVENTVDPRTLRDTTKNYKWEVLGHTKCPYTKLAIDLLKTHGENIEEKSIQYIDTPNTAWKARLFELGASYTPVIFRDGRLFGSLGELESYYRRTFVPIQD